MKYTITKKFTLTNEKFEIICDSKLFATAKATTSKEYNGRHNIKISNPMNKYTGDDTCTVEPDPTQPRSYLIYLINEKKRRFGQLSYQLLGNNDYVYTIIIGNKLYQVRSSDLKYRPLTIVENVQATNPSEIVYPKTLFQVIEPFSKLNKKFHVTINDDKCHYGYLAIAILLELHECQQPSS